ncbi:MAG: ABC transporter ATP-binding protein [Bacteroidota bacterium]
MLFAENIKKSYGSLPVLKGIDLQIAEGEIVSIVGASGAGKSTLLQILGTLDTPDSGTLRIAGTDMLHLRGDKLARFRNLKIGFIFQFHNLLPEFTALENVCIPGFIAGDDETKVRRRAQELLEMLDLGARMQHKPDKLSGGEQQRTSVARALINNPAIVLADEPSGNLDSHNAEELHKLFFRLRDERKQTFAIVTHNQALAEMTDRRLEMRDGMIVSGTEPVTI